MHNEHGKPRVAQPQRKQAVIRFEMPEQTLSPSHPARVLWEEAIATVQDLQKSRPANKPARASTTDSEARVMKMADGGFRPAYNVRMATAGSEMGGPRTIVGVQVTSVGSDMGSIGPMLDEVEDRVGCLPMTLVADANHAAHECIRDAARRGVVALVAEPERGFAS